MELSYDFFVKLIEVIKLLGFGDRRWNSNNGCDRVFWFFEDLDIYILYLCYYVV